MNKLSDIVRVVRVTHSKHGRRNDKLTDVKMLKAVVDESGITINAIADKMGCSSIDKGVTINLLLCLLYSSLNSL